ncbi:MAG: hypothetical protein ABH880_00445 [Patescibacteria group bacterium]
MKKPRLKSVIQSINFTLPDWLFFSGKENILAIPIMIKYTNLNEYIECTHEVTNNTSADKNMESILKNALC